MKNIIMTIAIIFVLLVVAGHSSLLTGANWGSLTSRTENTVTVYGSSKSKQQNKSASFTAGIEVRNIDKQKAITDVSSKTRKLIDDLTAFGISKDDIKTQNMSTYQQQDFFTEAGVQRSKPGEWSISQNLEIKYQIKEGSKPIEELTLLLNNSGATNVWGPNFTVGDDQLKASKELIESAITDAREKAQKIATASGRTLGKVLSVTDNGSSYGFGGVPMYDVRGMGGGGGMPVEPGSSDVNQNLLVVFELR